MTHAILACTGLDKSLGSLARDVAIRGAEALECEIICPVLLHSAPARYEKILAGSDLIIIDGCPTRCATKLANQVGAKIDRKVLLTDALKASGLTLEPSLSLGPNGIQLAQRIVDDLVRDLSSASQFLVITHNKRTMELADMLYGVTMEQKGVSKLVSVKLAEAKTSTGQEAA